MLSLEAFINDKVKNYIEPEKEGVPKGNEIGFSKEKHHASLLILRMDSLKEIANRVKAPYGTARNWKTDKGFKRETKRHADEFAKKFIEILDKSVSNRHKKLPSILQNTFKEIKNLPINRKNLKELGDVRNYSKYLCTELFRKLWNLCFDIMPYQDINGEDSKKVINRARQQSTPSTKAKTFVFQKALLDEKQLTILIFKLDEYTSALDILFNAAKLGSQNISSRSKGDSPVRLLYKLLHERVIDCVDSILQKDGAIEEKDRKLASYFLLLANSLYKDTAVN
jgi:hypothetical protein